MKENHTCRWIGGRLYDVIVREDESITIRQVFDRRPEKERGSR